MMKSTANFDDRRNLAQRSFDKDRPPLVTKVTVGRPGAAAEHIELGVPGGGLKWWEGEDTVDAAHVAAHRLMRHCYKQYMDQLHLKVYDDVKRRVHAERTGSVDASSDSDSSDDDIKMADSSDGDESMTT